MNENNYDNAEILEWNRDVMLEVDLITPNNFLKVRETLTRIGIPSKKEKKLFQSCLLLHKQGRYYIVHFKEMFALDGRYTDICWSDIERRNSIARLLEQWGLVKILDPEGYYNCETVPLNQIKVIKFSEKNDWELVTKYNIRTRIQPQQGN